jgi:hypothetical protein
MDEIYATVMALLPPKRKSTLSGWISFNAVCCHHRGNSQDTRMRGGILPNQKGGFQYNCFNCNFKAGWTPGNLLSNNTKQMFSWLGMTELEIGRLGLVALRLRDEQAPVVKELKFDLEERPLPEGAKSIKEWAMTGCVEPDFLSVIDYIDSRGMSIDWYPWFWSPEPGYRDRVILPFYHEGKIVGYTGRKIKDGKPKYLTHSQPGCVFNIDHQDYQRKFVIVVEGQFDAVAVDGCAVMHNEISDVQVMRLNALNREVIIVPDRDKPGAQLLKYAIKNNWSASLPPWGDDIKDVADAVKRYGRLYALATILHYRVSGEIKINLIKKKLEGIDD